MSTRRKAQTPPSHQKQSAQIQSGKKATAIAPLTLSVGKIARDGDLSLGLLIWQCGISPNPNKN